MRYKILAVDDNTLNIKLLRHALVDPNYEIYTAISGEEALEKAAKHKPDLILLDVVMPGMDGFEVYRRLQENKETADIRVLFLSAKNEAIDKTRGLALGAIDYLTKPFDMTEINARIRNHLKMNERYIQLVRKIQMLERNEQKDKTKEQTDKVLKLLQTTDQEEISVNKKAYKLQAYIINSEKPSNGFFLSRHFDSQRLFFFSFSGLDKDYPTLLLKQMMQKFIQGFLSSLRSTRLSVTVLNQLVTNLILAFPDERYQTSYTFILGYLDLSAGEGYFYLENQHMPLWIYPDGTYRPLKGKKLKLGSSLVTLIKAEKVTLPKKGMLFCYQNGLQKLPNDLFEQRILPHLKKTWKNPNKALQIVKKYALKNKNDSVFTAISV
ncbi:MAG TPA: response regulator [Calditrichaeota bacterium]|nr:response regulator [Calditrichota bacterium]